MKKILTIGLAVTMLMSLFTMSNIQAEEINVGQNNYQSIIKQQTANLTGISEANMQVIKLNANNDVATTYSGRENDDIYALEMIMETDGLIEQKILIPYCVVGDKLVNSFEYAEAVSENNNGIMPLDQDITYQLTDTVLNVSCYYNTWRDTDYTWNIIYTPKSLYFSWTSSNSSVYIEDIAVYFTAIGDYYRINPYGSMGYETRVDFEVYEMYPAKGTAYGDWAQAMDDNYGLMCNDLTVHGGFAEYSVNYYVNNVKHYDNGVTTVFSK